MKKWVKRSFLVAVIFFLLGILGVGVGAALGAGPGAVRTEFHNRYDWSERREEHWDHRSEEHGCGIGSMTVEFEE